MAEDALNADKMNVSSGGKQPQMRDTIRGGDIQWMVDDNGVPKLVLEVEDTAGMRAKEMKELQKTFPDFLT